MTHISFISLLAYFVLGCGAAYDKGTLKKYEAKVFLKSSEPDYAEKYTTIPFEPKFMNNPEDPNFFVLDDGLDLKKFDKKNRLIARNGVGVEFGKEQIKTYLKLKANKLVHWIIRDLETGKVIDLRQDTVEKEVEGASVPKAIVAAAALHNLKGTFKTEKDWFEAFELLVESENQYWDNIQRLAGGSAAVNEFSEDMGYEQMKPAHHDRNTINAWYLSQFLYDIFHGHFIGAEVLFKIMSACNTGRGNPPSTMKGPKYIPSDIYMGGKTGTWDKYQHDMRFLRFRDHWYAIVVLVETGKSEDVAIMFGGLFREYLEGTL